jgi:GntR family transcriptional regulator
MARAISKRRVKAKGRTKYGYRQIAQTIKHWILSGRLNAGDRISSEGELAIHFSVARLTIRRALKSLVESDMIVQKRPLGTFVKGEQPRQPIVAPLDQWNKQIADQTVGTSWRLINQREIVPPLAIQTALGISGDVSILEYSILRLQKSSPIALTIVNLAPWARDQIGVVDFKRGHLLRTALSDAGIEAVRIHQSLGCQLTDPDLATHLKIDSHSPVLTILRTNSDSLGRTITFDQVYIRTDKYRYDIEFVHNVGTGLADIKNNPSSRADQNLIWTEVTTRKPSISLQSARVQHRKHRD